MKWIRTLMTWLDDGIGFLWTCCIYICVELSGLGNRWRVGPRFTSITEPVFCNCSVPGQPATLSQVLWILTRTLFSHFHLQLPVDRPRARLTGHTGGCQPVSCRLTGVLCRRSTGQGRGRPGRLCARSTGPGPGRRGQLWKPCFRGSFPYVLRTLCGTLATLFRTHLTICEDVLS